jgi:hypothetical protein
VYGCYFSTEYSKSEQINVNFKITNVSDIKHFNSVWLDSFICRKAEKVENIEKRVLHPNEKELLKRKLITRHACLET